MDFIGEKIIRLQDAKFKIHSNNSNEASIFITSELAEKLSLVPDTPVTFRLDKSDLIKLLCFTYSFNQPLYKKDIIVLNIIWFEKYLFLINKHFDSSSEFTFETRKQSQDRWYFISIEQKSGLNIRDLFIQDHTKLLFYKNEDNIIKIDCSDSRLSDITDKEFEDELVEEIVLRQFALKSLKYITNKYGEEFLKKSITQTSKSKTDSGEVYRTYLFSKYFTQGLLFSFESEQGNGNSRLTPRIINSNLKILEEKYIYLSTEWAYTGTSNLLFWQLVKFIEAFTNNEYTAIRVGEEGPFRLIQKIPVPSVNFDHKIFAQKTQEAGLIFSDLLIRRFIASLCAKPFVILTGLSGSGKTKLAQAFAQWICYKEAEGEKNKQYCIVPVGADWTNREPLLGFPNAIENTKYVKPENGVLDLINDAKDDPLKPYFLILDEMNLSHVERYFADFLSTMESDDKIPLHSIIDGNVDIPKHLPLPKNLFIVGTVNIDETTYMFSPKVLDRANTIEFRVTKKELSDFIDTDPQLKMDILKGEGQNMGESFINLASASLRENNLGKSKETLKLFFAELKKSGAEFGYRTTLEIGRLMFMLETLGEKDDNLLDIAVMQKLLPKLHGSRKKLSKTLPVLGSFCLEKSEKLKEEYLDKFASNTLDEKTFESDPNIKYKISFEKICRMYKNAIENGYASYAEA
jgi:hypothetical protein